MSNWTFLTLETHQNRFHEKFEVVWKFLNFHIVKKCLKIKSQTYMNTVGKFSQHISKWHFWSPRCRTWLRFNVFNISREHSNLQLENCRFLNSLQRFLTLNVPQTTMWKFSNFSAKMANRNTYIAFYWLINNQFCKKSPILKKKRFVQICSKVFIKMANRNTYKAFFWP